jgi:hypothetical protein
MELAGRPTTEKLEIVMGGLGNEGHAAGMTESSQDHPLK